MPPQGEVSSSSLFHTRAATVVALLLATVSLVALAAFVWQVLRASAQIDYGVYDTAGEALNRGLSPYRHYPDADPPLWDGTGKYRHSNFLYPPLAATLFQPLARLPYSAAKALWSAAGLGALTAALIVFARWYGWRGGVGGWAVLTALAAGFYPVWLHLERGQIDGLILLLLVAGLALLERRRGPAHWLAGLALAGATLLKLHCVLLLPMLLLRRKFAAAAGFGAGALALGLLSLWVNGPLLAGYAATELPRIALYAGDGPSAWRLSGSTLAALQAGVGPHEVRRDGQVYQRELLRVPRVAALTAPLRYLLSLAGFSVPRSFISMGVAASWVLLIAAAQWVVPGGFWPAGARSQALFWQLALVGVMLASPYTWVMNLVWLLPLLVVVLAEWQTATRRTSQVAVAGLALGLALIGAHHPVGLTAPPAVVSSFLLHRYPLGQLVVAAALLVLWAQHVAEGASTKARR